MSKKFTISSWSLMFAPKRSSRTTKVSARQSMFQCRVRQSPRLQLQIHHKLKNGEVRKGTAVRFDLSKGAGRPRSSWIGDNLISLCCFTSFGNSWYCPWLTVIEESCMYVITFI